MKIEEVRERLERLNLAELRQVGVQLYKMLPKKVADGKGADRLICDPQGFVETGKSKKAPVLPDLDQLEFETQEFLENAAAQRYFAPNRIISKGERTQWRFVAKRLYKEWCLLAAQPENLASAAKALEDLYRILLRGCQVYLFPSTDTFRAIGVPQQEFLEQLLVLEAQLKPPNQWIPHALSLVHGGTDGDTLTAQLQDVLVRALKIPDLKEAALELISRQLGKGPPPASGDTRQDPWEKARRSRDLLRLGFQVTWALGEKERAVEWLRVHAHGEDDAGHLVLQHLLETKDREVWIREYEAIRREQPAAAESWAKTFEQAQCQTELPAWRVN